MTLKVLNFIGRLSHLGGIQTVVRQLLRGLDTDHFDSHICTIRSHSPDEELPSLGQHHWYSLELNGTLTIWRRILVLARLRRLMKKLSPDVMHLHSGQAWYAFLAGFGLGIPYVLEIHDAPQSGRVTDKNNRLEAFWIRQGWAKAVVHSSEVRKQVSSFSDVPAEKLAYLPLAIDTRFYGCPITDPLTWKQVEGVGSARLVFYAARLVPSKNLPLFLEVARQVIAASMVPVVFAVAGGGGELESLKALANSFGIGNQVKWLGGRYGYDLVDAYHACDVYLTTSDYEGFGLTLVEAMAAGKPVVSTAVGGTVDIVVDGETGRLCPAGAAESLATAVLELLNDPLRAKTWGLAGQKRALERFDLPAFQHGFESIYRQTAGQIAQ